MYYPAKYFFIIYFKKIDSCLSREFCKTGFVFEEQPVLSVRFHSTALHHLPLSLSLSLKMFFTKNMYNTAKWVVVFPSQLIVFGGGKQSSEEKSFSGLSKIQTNSNSTLIRMEKDF